jgi:hypothetical protein
MVVSHDNTVIGIDYDPRTGALLAFFWHLGFGLELFGQIEEAPEKRYCCSRLEKVEILTTAGLTCFNIGASVGNGFPSTVTLGNAACAQDRLSTSSRNSTPFFILIFIPASPVS